MKTLQHFDSLYNRKKNGIIREDHEVFSLDDVHASRQLSSLTSLFNDYGFSDDEDENHGSCIMQASLYLDDISGDSEETRRKKKDRKQKKELASRPSGGALEDLIFSPNDDGLEVATNIKKRDRKETAPLSRKSLIDKALTKIPRTPHLSPKRRIVIDALSLSSRYRTNRPEGDSVRSPTMNKSRSSSLSGPRHRLPMANDNFVVDSDIEKDTDDEGVKLATDREEPTSLWQKSVIKKVEDKSPPTPLSSKRRIVDALSLSSRHRKSRRESHSVRSPTMNKSRSSSLSAIGARLIRLPVMPKNDFVVDSDIETDSDDEDVEFPTDSKEATSSLCEKSVVKKVEDNSPRTHLSSKRPIRDALSLSSHRPSRHEGDSEVSLTVNKPRSSSLSGPRHRRTFMTDSDLGDDSDAALHRKSKRSTSLVSTASRRSTLNGTKTSMEVRRSSKQKSLDRSCHSISCDDNKTHRSASVQPKLSKKKTFDQSIHSTTSNDDEKSPRSASVSQKKKKRSSSAASRGKGDLESSSRHSATRSSTVKRKKKKDLLDCSNHSQVSSASAVMSPKRKSKSTPVLVKDSAEKGRRVSKSSKKSSPSARMSSVSPKKRREPSIKKNAEGDVINAEGDVIQPESFESLWSSFEHGKRASRSKSVNRKYTKNQALINASLASSEHGGRRTTRDRDEEKLNIRKMKRRNSSIA